MFVHKLGFLSKFLVNNQHLSSSPKVRGSLAYSTTMNMECKNICWVDLEMTGLDVRKDKIMEIACLITDKDLNIIAEAPCMAIQQPKEVLEKMNSWCKKHHTESGLSKMCLESKINMQEAEKILLEFLQKHIPKGKVPLAGNSIYMDRLFLRDQMPLIDDYLLYRVIDVSTVKELARRWNPEVFRSAPKKILSHRSLDDIKESIAELRFYHQNFFRVCDH